MTALALGTAFLVLLGAHVIDYIADGSRPQETAYAAMLVTLLGAQGLVTAALVIVAAVVLARVLRGHFTARRHQAVELTALFGAFVAAQWLLTLLVLYVSPAIW